MHQIRETKDAAGTTTEKTLFTPLTDAEGSVVALMAADANGTGWVTSQLARRYLYDSMGEVTTTCFLDATGGAIFDGDWNILYRGAMATGLPSTSGDLLYHMAGSVYDPSLGKNLSAADLATWSLPKEDASWAETAEAGIMNAVSGAKSFLEFAVTDDYSALEEHQMGMGHYTQSRNISTDSAWFKTGEVAGNMMMSYATGMVAAPILGLLGPAATWTLTGAGVGMLADDLYENASTMDGWDWANLGGSMLAFGAGVSTRVAPRGMMKSGRLYRPSKPALGEPETPGSPMSRMGQLRAKHGRLFDEYMHFRSQGHTAAQSHALTKPYKGWGHHFLPRRWKLPKFIQENSFNILKPKGISKGRFYELHYRVDPHFKGAGLPKSVGGSWKPSNFGLTKYGQVGRVWHACPTKLKLAIPTTTAISAGAYWWASSNDE